MEISYEKQAEVLENLAEESVRRGDYETAAHLFRRLAVYYGLVGDKHGRRKFAIRAGEYYMRAAEALPDDIKVMALYLKAMESFTEGGVREAAHFCGLRIWERFASIKDGVFEVDSEGIGVLRAVSDHFAERGDLEKANIMYKSAAEMALKSGKLLLAGRLYKSAGDCNLRSGKIEEAADLYIKAANMYFSCEEYFEAAWSYCEAGFLLICLRRFKEASDISEMAEESCRRGQISIFLRDLSNLCNLLSRGLISEAREKWDKIRMKIRKEYAQIIESSFRSVEGDYNFPR
ncbi:MAG: hypothetical protein QXF59_06325 [Candidatus Bathyarchaeia archaeon]|nr:hypothetical protein [Candidatus Bathyarchaeota archaeon]